MLGANVMWGLMSPVAKTVLTAGVIGPFILTDMRIWGAAVLFWLLSFAMPREHVGAVDLLRLAGAGMLGIVFNQGCFIFGVSLTSPGEASIVTTTMPLWVMLLAAVILKEPITARKVGGIVLGASGALLLVLGGSSVSGKGSNPVAGDLLVLTAQFSYALYLTLYKNFIRRYSLATLMKWMFTFAALATTVFSFRDIVATDWSALSPWHWGGVVYVVVCGTFLAYICVMVGQKNLRPTIVGMYNYVQPIVASVVGVYLGLDVFTPQKVVAVLLIFGGVWLVTISRARHS